MIFGKNALVAGHSAEDIAEFRGFWHGHHAETIHAGFERLRRINFRDDDLGAIAARAAGKPASAPAVAGDHEFRSR